MSLKIFITLFFGFSFAVAQQAPPVSEPAPVPAPAPAASAPQGAAAPVPPAPANPVPPNPVPAQPEGSPPAPAPVQAPAPGVPPGAPPLAAPAAPPPVLAPVDTGPALPSLVTGGDKKDGKASEKEQNKPSIQEIEMNSALRNKSPFMIPTELYLKIKKRQGEKVVEKVIDDTVSAKLRWPLRSYSLVGVFAGVKIPKALIQDREGKVHTFRTKELIANSGGYISEIGNGEVIVVERGAEIKLSLKKDSRN